MSKRSECDEARFLKDVANHDMHVLRDDGVHRHLRFKRNGTGCYYFDIITWSGHLCYTGDMGTYVFTRLHDMFEFFRMGDHDWNKNPNGLSINPGYWSEKLIAVDRHDGHEEFDEDEFKRRVNEVRVQWMRQMKEEGHDKDERRELWEEVESEVVDRTQDGEHAATSAVYEFRKYIGGNSYAFEDFFDGSMNRYTLRFLWCCYALAWAINKYDKSKEKQDGQ
jgi:hypothetical protein